MLVDSLLWGVLICVCLAFWCCILVPWACLGFSWFGHVGRVFQTHVGPYGWLASIPLNLVQVLIPNSLLSLVLDFVLVSHACWLRELLSLSELVKVLCCLCVV